MASSQIMSLSGRITTPVELCWTRDGEPRVNVDESDTRYDRVLDEHDTDNAEGIAESVLNEYERSRSTKRQLGLFVGNSEDATYIREAEALATVDGIDDEIATKLVDWYGDIPGLCKEMRRDQYLSALKHDAYVEAENEKDAEWVEDVDAGPELERRLKEAGVWTEPTDVVA